MTLTYTPRRVTLWVPGNGDTQKHSVFALVASNGLAYSRVLNPKGKAGNYVVFHVASGLIVVPPVVRIPTPKKCQQIIAALDPLTDWRQSLQQTRLSMRFCFVAFLDALEQVGVQLRQVVEVRTS